MTTTTPLRRTLVTSFLAAAFALTPHPLAAQSTTTRPAPSTDDPAVVQSFFDEAMMQQLTNTSIAGGVVSVVKNGEVLFQKGYGYADVKHGLPVDPMATMFRVGSITKLFTATAVMQLVEQGKLDLDTDVNKYLDFEIPDTFGQPITLTHLLTHTAGFENRFIGMWPNTARGVEPLGRWLATNRPARVRRPGLVASYSNYGAALAGYIVERVSGLSFARYLDQNIFGPLNMGYSSADQPIEETIRSRQSRGYRGEGGKLAERDFEWLNMAPAGVVSSSANDVARFMIAHLQLGRLGNRVILREETARRMHQQQFANAVGGNGIGYGFYETSRPGLRAIGHGGDTQLFHSVLTLFPEQNLGVFISFNSAAAAESAEEVRTSFVDRFFPSPSSNVDRTELSADQLDQVTGTYRLTNTSYTSVEKVQGLFGAYSIRAKNGGVEVSAPADDELFANATTRLLPVKFADPAQLAFETEDRATSLVFRTDEASGTTFAFVNQKPVFSLERLAPRAEPQRHRVTVLVVLAVLLSGFVAFLVSLIRRKRTRQQRPETLPARLGPWVMGANGALALLVVLGLLLVLIQSASLAAGDTRLLSGVLTVVILLAIGVGASVPITVLAWKNRYWTTGRRIHFSVVMTSGVVLIGMLNYWNLIGWHY